ADRFRGLSADGARAVETEQLAAGRLGLYNSVRDKGQRAAYRQRELVLLVFDSGNESQRQSRANWDFCAVMIGRQMAGISDDGPAIWTDPGCAAGYEAAVHLASQAAIQIPKNAGGRQ